MKTFEITGYGPTHSDETREYIIKLYPNNTVRDVVQDIISNQYEWGYIGIKDEENPWFGKYPLEYGRGLVINIDEVTNWKDKLDKKVIGIKGDGGWSRSDYQLEIE